MVLECVVVTAVLCLDTDSDHRRGAARWPALREGRGARRRRPDVYGNPPWSDASRASFRAAVPARLSKPGSARDGVIALLAVIVYTFTIGARVDRPDLRRAKGLAAIRLALLGSASVLSPPAIPAGRSHVGDRVPGARPHPRRASAAGHDRRGPGPRLCRPHLRRRRNKAVVTTMLTAATPVRAGHVSGPGRLGVRRPPRSGPGSVLRRDARMVEGQLD